jgi:hypothetical protein
MWISEICCAIWWQWNLFTQCIYSKVALCHGGETWTINRKDAHKMEAAQMRFYGRYFLSDYRTAQGTLNVRNRLKTDNTVADLKARKKSFFDTLKRMDMKRLQRMVLQYHPTGRRDIGRPRRRWKDQERTPRTSRKRVLGPNLRHDHDDDEIS